MYERLKNRVKREKQRERERERERERDKAAYLVCVVTVIQKGERERENDEEVVFLKRSGPLHLSRILFFTHNRFSLFVLLMLFSP